MTTMVYDLEEEGRRRRSPAHVGWIYPRRPSRGRDSEYEADISTLRAAPLSLPSTTPRPESPVKKVFVEISVCRQAGMARNGVDWLASLSFHPSLRWPVSSNS
jgi:hypothetical protein